MKIRSVQTYFLNASCGKLVSDYARTLDSIELTVVKVQTDEGIEGTGYTYTLRGGEGVKAIIDKELSKIVVDRNPLEIEDIWNEMCKSTDARTHGGTVSNAIAAVDIALWDIMGKVEGKPLYKLLGGRRNKVPIYDTDSGWLHYKPKELAKNALMLLEKGFKGFKIKVGKKNLEEDVERIKAVRDAVGDKLTLMVDANQAFTVQEAIRRGKAYERYNIYWFEEPTVDGDLNDYMEIASALSMPIATGEWIYHLDIFQKLIQKKAADIIQPDVCRVKGITEWIKIAEYAENHGIPVAPHFNMELHVHLVCAFQNGLTVEHMPWLAYLLKNPLTIKEGYALAPEIHGHGIEFKEEFIKSSIR
ncbi:MAG: mandelate racemase/muconate lactonizing enzyme family protein [Nitrososphaeria archaeon]|nr:mandelate racemase/muconate lactonizing enzyme family protein [Nitrososphaeria archaeon]